MAKKSPASCGAPEAIERLEQQCSWRKSLWNLQERRRFSVNRCSLRKN